MEALTQIGVGGIFAILVLREVFAFIGRQKDHKSHPNGTAGGKAPEYWEMSHRNSVKQALEEHEPRLKDIIRDVIRDMKP